MVKMGYKAVRNQRYKYIQYTDLEGMNELYDLVNDPYELHNLIDDPGMTKTLNEMKEDLNRLLQQTRPERLP
jgi:N-acetylglucosamine-6-sulfatase